MTTGMYLINPSYEEYASTTKAGASYQPELMDWVCAALFSAVVLAVSLIEPAMRSWIVVPLFACGMLTGLDAVAWLRGRIDLFDPMGVIGILGIHLFFLAPVLHVTMNVWMAFVRPLQDWPDWIGWMGVINALGLLLYRFVRRAAISAELAPLPRRAPSQVFWVLLSFGLVLTAALQVVVYWQFGGIGGYIDAFERLKSKFLGWGWVFMVSESFPILFMIAFAVYYLRQRVQPSWLTIAAVLVVFFGLKLIFGGLRGSRGNTIWGMFWAAGIVHLMVRRIPRIGVLVGLGFMLLFMYVYGFYKADGIRGLESALDPTSRSHLQRDTGRTFNMVLLGDLARADVQAYLLRQTCSPQSHYEWAWGRTYLGTAALLIPRAIWPDRPEYKVRYGTNALFGEGSTDIASNVYGLAGEAMLNFGPAAVLFTFAFLGLLVARLRQFTMRLPPRDLRWVLVPFLVSLVFTVLVADSDNVLFVLFKEGTLPFIIVYVGSHVLARGRDATGGEPELSHWSGGQSAQGHG